jgi:hypothetical protein
MKLAFDPDPSDKYPHGYWYAYTDHGEHDADGPDPLTAVTSLAIGLEERLREVTGP